MNELQDILTGALQSAKTLTFPTVAEAKSWQFRAHNYIRRKQPELAQLMISRRGNRITVKVPQFTIHDGEIHA